MSLNVMYKKIMDLEHRTLELEQQIKILLSMNKSNLNQHIDTDNIANKDHSWDCEKCSLNLGFMDSEESVVRVSCSGIHAFWEPSPESSFAIICPKCSFINKIQYNLPTVEICDNI